VAAVARVARRPAAPVARPDNAGHVVGGLFRMHPATSIAEGGVVQRSHRVPPFLAGSGRAGAAAPLRRAAPPVLAPQGKPATFRPAPKRARANVEGAGAPEHAKEADMSRTTEPDLSRVAAAIGEPARAAMLAALLGGEWLPAGELARRAGIAPQTASGHLARLVAAGLVARRVAGRRREYALAGRDVAAALEALARIAPQRVGAAGERASGGRSAAARASGEQALRFARTCYDHLAGRLGVLLTDTLAARGLIPASCHDVTPRGEEWLRGLGIDVEALRRARRTFARPCLD